MKRLLGWVLVIAAFAAIAIDSVDARGRRVVVTKTVVRTR